MSESTSNSTGRIGFVGALTIPDCGHPDCWGSTRLDRQQAMTLQPLNAYYTAIMREVAADRDWRHFVRGRDLDVAAIVREKCAEIAATTTDGVEMEIRNLDLDDVLREVQE